MNDGAQPLVTPGAGLWGARRLRFESLDSTNRWALEHEDEWQHGDVLWADAQTAGRGRLGRTWFAGAGQSLTLSVGIRDERLFGFAPNLGQAAALALRELVAAQGLRARLKWPNDVLTPRGKIAGILLEGGQTPHALVLGVGLNVNTAAADLAAAVPDRAATSLLAETGRIFDVAALGAGFLRLLQPRLDGLARAGLEPLLAEWRRHDALEGHRVAADTAGGRITGRYAGLDHTGRLKLVDDAGREHVLWSGEVERVRSARTGERHDHALQRRGSPGDGHPDGA
jgi:BirA family biotin operon repressor/biotin-[acetyl-CoA-carboxylase] ligase